LCACFSTKRQLQFVQFQQTTQEASFELCSNGGTEPRFSGIIGILYCSKQRKMQIIPLNLDSVLLFLHNSKVAYCCILRLFSCLGSFSRLSHSFKCISCFHSPPDLLPAEGVFVPLIVLISHASYWLHPAATGFKLALDKKSFEIQRPRAFIVTLRSLPVRLTL